MGAKCNGILKCGKDSAFVGLTVISRLGTYIAMLPDFPNEKASILETLKDAIDEKQQRFMGPFWSEVRRQRIYEGRAWQLKREDGTENVSEYKEIGSNLTVNIDEVPYLTIEKLIERIDTLARDLAEQQVRGMLKSITEETFKTGQQIDNHNAPFDKQTFIKLIDSVFIDFDKHGNPKMPSMLVHPDLEPSIKKLLDSLSSDSDFDSEFAALIEKKKAEWYAKESSRKLVD